ncbi:MAG: hypothetical protein CL485_07050 [Acidobacteria bacterium]|nr:hypothetical protein [Acidobacteriota bacterium]
MANGERNTKTRIINIAVWEYEDDSLRRQFLWDLQAQLREQKLSRETKIMLLKPTKVEQAN